MPNSEHAAPEAFEAAWQEWWDAQFGADLEPHDLAQLFWDLGVAEGVRRVYASWAVDPADR